MSEKSPAFESPSFVEAEAEAAGDADPAEGPGEPEDTEREATGEAGISQAVLEHIARSLVDEPDAVEIVVSEGRSGPAFSLRVAPSDMGRVIGKRGRIAQAMRTVVRAAAAREGTEASVDIVD